MPPRSLLLLTEMLTGNAIARDISHNRVPERAEVCLKGRKNFINVGWQQLGNSRAVPIRKRLPSMVILVQFMLCHGSSFCRKRTIVVLPFQGVANPIIVSLKVELQKLCLRLLESGT